VEFGDSLVCNRGNRNREMKDVALAGEDCVRVLGPGPEVRAYEEG
jgi:hypothetical protein